MADPRTQTPGPCDDMPTTPLVWGLRSSGSVQSSSGQKNKFIDQVVQADFLRSSLQPGSTILSDLSKPNSSTPLTPPLRSDASCLSLRIPRQGQEQQTLPEPIPTVETLICITSATSRHGVCNCCHINPAKQPRTLIPARCNGVNYMLTPRFLYLVHATSSTLRTM